MLKNIELTGFADEISNDLSVQVNLLKELGITYMELRSVDGISIGDFTLDKAKEVKRYLSERNIQVSAIGSPIGKIPITQEFNSHFENFKRVVEISHIFETSYIRMFSFFIPEGEAADKYQEEVFLRIGKLIDYAKTEKVILLHENEKDIYGDTANRCLSLMKEFYGEHFKAIFDFANFVQCKEDTLEAYKLLEPYIHYIHIKDAIFATGEVVPAGLGDGNLESILRRLDGKGYEGFLSLEPHLTDFSGLKNLEQKAAIRKKTNQEEAFNIAFHALREILNKE